MSIGHQLMNVPLPQMIKNLGTGIAEAQYALDKVSLKIAQMMSGFKTDKQGNLVKDQSALIVLEEGGKGHSLLSLGFTPTFYQFVETVIEVKMALSMSSTTEVGTSVSAGVNIMMVSASVNASFSQKFQYSAEGSSLMRTKLVTVPAPVILEKRLNALMNKEEEEQQ